MRGGSRAGRHRMRQLRRQPWLPLWLVATIAGAALALAATRFLSLPPPLTGEEPLAASVPQARARADELGRLVAGAEATLAAWEAEPAVAALLSPGALAECEAGGPAGQADALAGARL